MVLNEIYGASPASKLFLNVREKQSLCYHCGSMLDLYKGVIIASAGMKPENREVTQSAMLSELADIARGNISQAELQAAKSSLAYSYRQAYDNPTVLSRFYAAREFACVRETVEQWSERIAAVTIDDVVAAAEQIGTGAIFFLKGTLDGEGEDEL
jgi:predicted Zn-dependent peptidase